MANKVIRNGITYAIYNSNYSELTGKPSINNHELANGSNYSAEDLELVITCTQAEYDAMASRNPQCIYIVSDGNAPLVSESDYLDLSNKPSVNGVVLSGDKTLSSLDIYSREEVANLMASGRSIYVVASLPSNPSANTLYYVGASAPYHVYLYDSNKMQVDLGSSELDLTEYYKKDESDARYERLTNRVQTIDSASTSTQYPSAKAIYDGFAPLASSVVRNMNSGNADYCVFNFTARPQAGFASWERRVFFSALNNPIEPSNNLFGFIETTQATNNSVDKANVYFEQEFTNYRQGTVGKTIKFRRTGSLLDCDFDEADDIVSNLSSITWKPWYPVEYPRIGLSVFDPSKSSGNISATVSGQVLNLEIRDLKFTGDITDKKIAVIPFSVQKSISYGVLSNAFATNDVLTIGANSTSVIYYINNVPTGSTYWGNLLVLLGY